MPAYSRRQVLQGGAAAALGAALLPTGLPRMHPAGTSGTAMPVFGCDHSVWADVASAVGAMRGERCYAPASKGVPGRWFRTHTGVTFCAGSIRPNISDILAGRLDAKLHAFARLVPKGAVITCWHEGEEPHNGIPAATLLAMHRRCHQIFSAEGARYVQITGGYSPISLGSRFPSYISPAVEAVFTDGYQYHAGEGADGVFGPVLDAVTKACGPGKLKGITETNSKYVSGRPAWFASAWNWATAHNLEACFVFWSARLPAFNWLPGDGAVITQLRKVRAASLA